MKKTEKNKKNSGTNLASSISIGLCLGAAYGIIFDNIPLGVGLGLCFGSAFGTIGSQKKKNDAEDK